MISYVNIKVILFLLARQNQFTSVKANSNVLSTVDTITRFCCVISNLYGLLVLRFMSWLFGFGPKVKNV